MIPARIAVAQRPGTGTAAGHSLGQNQRHGTGAGHSLEQNQRHRGCCGDRARVCDPFVETDLKFTSGDAAGCPDRQYVFIWYHGSDHEYSMDVSTPSAKRKSPITPTKPSVPPNKVIVSNKNDAELSTLTAAIEKLTARFDEFEGRLRDNSVILANLTKITEVNAAEIKDCKTKLRDLEKEVPALVKENADLKERVLEIERYKRRWNLKMQGLKEKHEENTRKEVLDILAKSRRNMPQS
ncbi:hypothetical protein WMY93_002129 [Mugilogobius chulae]|uniref:Uncharacterized protein n=1 Tax=Mugilogobius chulae TaxID=88201 RepID=A0AAW0PUA3_9GOBI